MGSATSVSLKYNSNHRELSAAAISIHKPSIISELILEQEIDVATAMALDDDDLPFVSAKKLDQIKLKVALKQLRTYLNGHQRTLHLSHSAMQLGTTTNPTINLSTSFSQSTSFLPSSLRIGLLESITDDSQTPRDSLMVLSNLVQSENTRALVRNDLDVTSSLLISLRNYGDKMDICKSSLEILLRQCFVEENLLLVIEQNGVQLILNLLKQHESNNNSKISESCVSILWLYGAHLISKRKERKRPVGYNSDSINGSSMMMMTDAGFPMTELERKEKKDLELLVIQNILWQMVRYKENSEVLSACCLALSTNIDLNNVSLIRHLLSSESLDILFSTMKKYNYILDVIEPCVTVIEKLSIVNIDRENGSKNENENRNNRSTRFIDGIDGEIRGEDYRNEMRMLGGVHLLREVILRWPNNRILRTKAQTALNRLQAPRLRTPPKRKIKRIVSVKPMVFKIKKKLNVMKAFKEYKKNKIEVASFVDAKDKIGLKNDLDNLFDGLPEWNGGKGSMVKEKKEQGVHLFGKTDTKWLKKKKNKKNKKNKKKNKHREKVKTTMEKETDAVLNMFGFDVPDEEEEEDEVLDLISPVRGETMMTTNPIDSEIQHIFELIDRDHSGNITYSELLRGLRTVAVREFVEQRENLKLLRPKNVHHNFNLIVKEEESHCFNLHAFNMFCQMVVNDNEVATEPMHKKNLESVDILFDLLDSNKDSVLTYSEVLLKLQHPDGIVMDLIESNPKLKDLLNPKKLKSTLTKIAKAHPSGKLTRGAFRMYVVYKKISVIERANAAKAKQRRYLEKKR